ncbi:unnamed protein product [Orchesella dallaii]
MLNDFSNTEKGYRARFKFYERPVWSNTPYKYELLSVLDPYDFTVKVTDSFTAEYEARLASLLENYAGVLDQKKVGNICKFMSDNGLTEMYVGMPVIFKRELGNGASDIVRAEVLAYNEKSTDVMLVDHGGVSSTAIDALFPMTSDILRIPKLGIPSRLAYIRPEETSWPTVVDFAKEFTGTCQIAYFQDLYSSTRAYETILEVDGVNIGIKFLHAGFAQPIDLPFLCNEVETKPARPDFPMFDFTSWIGIKTTVYGLRAFLGDDNRTRCILQMLPETVNFIQDTIVGYLDKTAENVKNSPFEIAPGVCCLARYGADEFYRAKILKKENDKVIVDYVDYKEIATVSVNDLLKMPDNLMSYPEGANECVITDFLIQGCEEDVKLSELVANKDLYAVLDGCDANLFGRALLVSLFRPVDFSGPDESFSEIFGVTEKPVVIREMLQNMEFPTEAQTNVFLKPRLPDPTKIYPGAMISVIRSWDSIWIQMDTEQDMALRIAAELTMFYQNLCASGLTPESFENFITEGAYVVAQLSDEDEDIWYRGKIVEVKEDRVLLHYIDYGNLDWVPNNEVYPLHSYFVKDHLMAFEVKLTA